jgi:hypothetical protein
MPRATAGRAVIEADAPWLLAGVAAQWAAGDEVAATSYFIQKMVMSFGWRHGCAVIEAEYAGVVARKSAVA